MKAAWTEKEVVHLLLRATFSATVAEVRACLKLGKVETVRRLVAGESLTNQATELLPLVNVKSDGKNLDPTKISDQQIYWFYRMVNTQAPLIEKMTLFWHGHFVSSYRKVEKVRLMVQQNELFRNHALGSFEGLLAEVSKNPAMMLYLDSNNNLKGEPNENYARELMELFTLGIGHYTEDDVKDAARSLTGWNVNKDTGEVTFTDKQHDAGMKTILHETGNFNEAELLKIIVEQKKLPQFMAIKLLQFFCTPQPSEDWVNQVADDFANEITVGEVLRRIFLSDRFYAAKHRSSLIKSPAEYVVGIVKSLGLPLSNGYVYSMLLMGQELYEPPDVAGWRGGAAWLTTSNLLARFQFAESASKRIKPALLTSSEYNPVTDDPKAWVELWGNNTNLWALGEKSTAVLAKYADDTFIHAQQKSMGMRGLLHLLLISPEAQMK